MIQWVNNYYFSKMLRGNSASFFSILLCLAMIEIIASATTLCSDVQARCMGRVGCSSAMRAYLLGCDDLLHGDVDGCPARCRKALISLLSSEEQSVGEAFMTCDCQGDELCALQRRRLAVCTPDVLVAIGDVYNVATPIDCSLAELVCSADTSCLTALNFYRHHCKKLFQGLQCSSRCNNSLAILYQLDKARKLRNCVCEGTEDYNCPALMMHTERLCFSNSRNFNHHHHQNQQQQQQQQVQPQHRHQSANAVARPANPRKGSSSGMGSSDPHNKIAAQLPMADAATGGRQTTYNQQYQHQQQLQQQQQQQQYQQQHHQQRLYQQQQRQPSQNSASLCVYPQPSSASIARCSRSTWWLVVILLNFFMFWTPYCYFNSLSITY